MDSRLTRRAFLRAGVPGAAGSSAGTRFTWGTPDAIPVTGTPRAALAGFDRMVTAYMHKAKVLGTALAVGYQGRLVYARGFGFAELVTKQPVRPNSLFRIASTSKPFTSAAVMRLVDQKMLRLSDHVAEILDVQVNGKPIALKGRTNQAGHHPASRGR